MGRVGNGLAAAFVALLLATAGAAAVEPGVADALAARNPVLAALKDRDPSAFEKAADLIVRARTDAGLDARDAPPETAPVARGAMPDAGAPFTPGNPDVLWLYNAAPEGMQDLVSLLKSAGQKPKT